MLKHKRVDGGPAVSRVAAVTYTGRITSRKPWMSKHALTSSPKTR